jgi:hypothetical protein
LSTERRRGEIILQQIDLLLRIVRRFSKQSCEKTSKNIPEKSRNLGSGLWTSQELQEVKKQVRKFPFQNVREEKFSGIISVTSQNVREEKFSGIISVTSQNVREEKFSGIILVTSQNVREEKFSGIISVTSQNAGRRSLVASYQLLTPTIM